MHAQAIILLAEDNPADVYLLRVALEQHAVDCQLLAFENGELALDYIRDVELGKQEAPDLFLLDLNLPKVDGREILRHIRGSAKLGNSRVMIWTSSDSPRDKLETGELRADKHVRKPSTVSAFVDLGGTIKEMLPLSVS